MPRPFALLAPLLLTACAFPEITFEADAALARADATALDDGVDVTNVADVTDEADVADASEASDVTTATDGQADGDALDCDRDHDGHRAQGGACGGDDCDDRDPNVHPGQGFVTFAPAATNPLPGDFDCDGVVQKKFTTGVGCGLLGGACTSVHGFTDDPPCGSSSNNYVTCADALPPLACKIGSTTTQTQACH